MKLSQNICSNDILDEFTNRPEPFSNSSKVSLEQMFWLSFMKIGQ